MGGFVEKRVNFGEKMGNFGGKIGNFPEKMVKFLENTLYEKIKILVKNRKFG